jgi:hypothetical protein
VTADGVVVVALVVGVVVALVVGVVVALVVGVVVAPVVGVVLAEEDEAGAVGGGVVVVEVVELADDPLVAPGDGVAATVGVVAPTGAPVRTVPMPTSTNADTAMAAARHPISVATRPLGPGMGP